MQLILKILIIGVFTYFLTPLSVWWVGMVLSFLVSFALPSSALKAFITGFLGVSIAWMLKAWQLDIENGGKFSSLIVELFPFQNSFMLIIAAGVISGLAGGSAGMSGTLLRLIFIQPKEKDMYL